MERQGLRRKVIVLCILLQSCAVPVQKQPAPGYEYLACLTMCRAPAVEQMKTYDAAFADLPMTVLGIPEADCRKPPPNCKGLPLYIEK